MGIEFECEVLVVMLDDCSQIVAGLTSSLVDLELDYWRMMNSSSLASLSSI